MIELLLTISFFFFFNDTATTEIYTLSLHDALPIFFHAVLSTCLLPASLPLALPHDRSGERFLQEAEGAVPSQFRECRIVDLRARFIHEGVLCIVAIHLEF